MLTSGVVEEVFEKDVARVRAKVQAAKRSLGEPEPDLGPEEATTKTRSRRWSLTRLDIPDPDFLFPIKVPLFIDPRARAN